MGSAKTVYKIRTSLCCDQPELGKLVGVSKQTISNWESGHRSPSMPHRRKLIELAKKAKIKIKPEDFLSIED